MFYCLRLRHLKKAMHNKFCHFLKSVFPTEKYRNMDKFTFILGVFLCFQISSVLTKNVFNLVQFSGCSLLILSNENNSAFDEVDIKTRLVEENQDNFFTYQIGTLVKKSQNNINRLQLLHCNVVILIDDENASKIINSIETSQLKYDTLLIITGKRNDFTTQEEPNAYFLYIS